MTIKRLKLAVAGSGMVVALGGVGVYTVVDTAATRAAGATPMTSAQIAALARANAAQDGDPNPILIQHSIGTREEANLVAGGDVVPGSEQSYLIAIRGHFTASTDGPLPPWTPNPTPATTTTYSVMTLVVDATTGQVTDFGLANDYPNLATLGRVTTDASSR